MKRKILLPVALTHGSTLVGTGGSGCSTVKHSIITDAKGKRILAIDDAREEQEHYLKQIVEALNRKEPENGQRAE